jgi:hypothetical protein
MGTPESVAAATESRWSATITRVNAKMKSSGFFDLPIPQMACPDVTADALLTNDVKQYTITYEGQLRWFNYTVVLLAACRATLLGVDNEMEDIAAKTRIKLREFNKNASKEDKVGAQEMSDIIDQDIVYNDLKLQQQELMQHKYLMQARLDVLELCLKVVSRTVEIRKTESQGGNRVNNLPNPNAYPGPHQQPQQPQGQWGGRNP